MTEPTGRTIDWAGVRDVLIVVVTVALTIWTVADSTLPAWLARLSIAGAIVAGLTLALNALLRIVARR